VGVSSITLSSLGNYGGATQTMIPLPSSPAICAGTATPDGGLTLSTNDQRGDARITTYTVNGTPTMCVDAGAVQTSYAMAFTTQPSPIAPETAIDPVSNFQAAVTLNESGMPFTASPATISLALTGNGTLTGGPAATSNGIASYSNLQISAAGATDTLAANLMLNPGLTPALAISAVSSPFQVEQVTPTLDFSPILATQVYGAAILSNSLNATATYNGSTVEGSFAYTATPVGGGSAIALATGTTALPAGVYTLTATFTPSDLSTYASPSATAVYTVTQATPNLALTCAAATYDGTAHSCTGSATGIGGVTVNGTWSFSPASEMAAGSYTVTGTFTSTDPNYTSGGTATSTLTIATATLNLIASDATKIYGTPNPTLTGSVIGAIDGDSFTESFTTTGTLSSPVGTYVIVPGAAGANLADYQQTITNGTLTVTQAGSATSLSLSSNSITPGQSVTLTATVTSTTTGTPTGTVSFYDNGSLLSTATLTGGIASYSATTLAAGVNHAITATYGGDVSFTGSSSSSTATVNVVPLDFSFASSGPSSQTVSAGGSASYQLTVTPTYGSYAGAVILSATGLPAGASATFSPSIIAADGGTQTVTFTIQTASQTASRPTPQQPASRYKMEPLALAVLLLFGVGGLRQSRRHLRRRLCVLIVLLGGAAMMTLSGCGGSSSSHQPQTYSITVTATAGNLQHSTRFTLNVQ
jgi:large repetitive protein